MTLDELRESGERIRTFFNSDLRLSLDYDAASVEWLSGYIDRNREVLSEEMRYGWALAFGYILGESIIRVFGGHWDKDKQFGDEWIVVLPNGIGKANPIGKAFKQLENEFDSIVSFFRITGLAIEKGGFDKIGRQAGGTEINE
jgi:hypothetical protein